VQLYRDIFLIEDCPRTDGENIDYWERVGTSMSGLYGEFVIFGSDGRVTTLCLESELELKSLPKGIGLLSNLEGLFFE